MGIALAKLVEVGRPCVWIEWKFLGTYSVCRPPSAGFVGQVVPGMNRLRVGKDPDAQHDWVPKLQQSAQT
jgi:hypothetical protein